MFSKLHYPDRPYYFILFDVETAAPSCIWRLKHKPVGASFIPRSKLSLQNSGTSSAIVYFTAQQDVHLLEEVEYAAEIQKEILPKPQRLPLQQNNVFEAIVGKLQTNQEEVTGRL
jgi:hypothetical protein